MRPSPVDWLTRFHDLFWLFFYWPLLLISWKLQLWIHPTGCPIFQSLHLFFFSHRNWREETPSLLEQSKFLIWHCLGPWLFWEQKKKEKRKIIYILVCPSRKTYDYLKENGPRTRIRIDQFVLDCCLCCLLGSFQLWGTWKIVIKYLMSSWFTFLASGSRCAR